MNDRTLSPGAKPTLSSNPIAVIRAWMQTQWERIPATPHSQPGSYARGYDGGLVDILRGLQAQLEKLPANAHETGTGEALAQQLRDARYCIGMLLQVAGGRVEIKPRHMIEFDGRKEILTFDDPVSGCRIMQLQHPPHLKAADGWRCVTCGHENPPRVLLCRNPKCTALNGPGVAP